MGSIDCKYAPECVDCTVKAFFYLEEHGFVCNLCLARNKNERHRLALLRFLRRPCKLANVVLQNELVGHTAMEFVLGDGMSDCCQRRECERIWIERGWACPMLFYRRELVALLDAQHGSRYCLPDSEDQLRHALATWTVIPGLPSYEDIAAFAELFRRLEST